MMGSWKAWVQGASEILPMETATWSPDTSLAPSSDGQKLAKESSQLWRATQAFGRARPSLLPALVVDADLRPAAAECGSWMITFQDREACTCTASA